jgi:uncharacterized membrane protein
MFIFAVLVFIFVLAYFAWKEGRAKEKRLEEDAKEQKNSTAKLQELAILFANGKIGEEEYLVSVQKVEKEIGNYDKKREGLQKLAALQKEGKISEQTYQASVKALEPQPTQANYEKPSALWYFAALFLGLIGAIVGYVAVKERDPDMANNILAIGVIVTIFGVLVLWFGYAWLMSLFLRF